MANYFEVEEFEEEVKPIEEIDDEYVFDEEEDETEEEIYCEESLGEMWGEPEWDDLYNARIYKGNAFEGGVWTALVFTDFETGKVDIIRTF